MSAQPPSVASHREHLAALGVVLSALALFLLGVMHEVDMSLAAPAVALVTIFAVAHRTILAWRSLLTLVILVILFVPIKRYALPVELPFQLEPYRLIVLLVFAAWSTSMLIDRRVVARHTSFDRPLAAFIFAALASEVVNISRFTSLQAEVTKQLIFFASFILLIYVITSIVETYDDVDFLVGVLLLGGATVALFAVVEWRTGYNAFDRLAQAVPWLERTGEAPELSRGGRLRVLGSSQHPIALGAALAMLVPLAVYRAYGARQHRWWTVLALLVLGSFATGSRTAIIMLLVIALVFIWLRPKQVIRLWPALLPLLVAVQFALPGTLGSIRAAFFPSEGLIAQENANNVGSGRLATLGPALETEFAPNPLLGEGFLTRVTVPNERVPVANGPILDDQWLGVLLETGLVGALALAWLFVRSVRRLGKEAKLDHSPRGWLLAGLAASIAAYGVSMFTYDAFSFIQVTFLLFVMMGLGSVLLQTRAPETHL